MFFSLVLILVGCALFMLAANGGSMFWGMVGMVMVPFGLGGFLLSALGLV